MFVRPASQWDMFHLPYLLHYKCSSFQVRKHLTTAESFCLRHVFCSKCNSQQTAWIFKIWNSSRTSPNRETFPGWFIHEVCLEIFTPKPVQKTSNNKKNGKNSDKCQITSYPLPLQPNNDNIYSDKRLEVWPPSLLSEIVTNEQGCQGYVNDIVLLEFYIAFFRLWSWIELLLKQ